MSVEVVKRKATEVIFEIGRGALHALAPDDFEYYACTFELINSKNIIEDIFHFPVMPSGISVARQSILTVKATGQSYLSQFNDCFVGKKISINGTFGRKFRLMVTKEVGQVAGTNSKLFQNFDLKVKTGYGALKLLEKIIENSQILDEDNQPKFLLFYNHTYNQNNIVEVTNFTVSQSLENNMMWNYNIEITMLGDIDTIIGGIDSKKNLYNLLSMSVINKSVNKVFDNISLGGIQESVTNLFG